jgi:hypothetical protein
VFWPLTFHDNHIATRASLFHRLGNRIESAIAMYGPYFKYGHTTKQSASADSPKQETPSTS